MKLIELEQYPLNHERIEKLMEEQGYTAKKMEDLADSGQSYVPGQYSADGISEKTIKRWVKKTTKKAHGRKINIVAQILDVDPRELIIEPRGIRQIWAPTKKFIRSCDIGLRFNDGQTSIYFECNFVSDPIQHGDRIFKVNAKRVLVQVKQTVSFGIADYDGDYAVSPDPKNIAVLWTGTERKPCWDIFPEDNNPLKGHVVVGNLCIFQRNAPDTLVATVTSQPGYLELYERCSDGWKHLPHISVLSDVLGLRGDEFNTLDDDLVLYSTRLELLETRDEQQDATKPGAPTIVAEPQM